MNDFYTDPAPGKNVPSGRLTGPASNNKKVQSESADEPSFKEVLTEAVNTKAVSPEVRRELVQQYKASLANGTYEVKAGELAEKMIQKIQENKTRAII